MKTFDLEGNVREVVGKKDSKKLRSEGKVPCVLYGLEENVHFSCDYGAVRKLVFTPNVYLVNLDINGKKYLSVMQDIQFHPIDDEPLHIDFLNVVDDKPIKIDVPVLTTGFAKGIREGGKLQLEMRRLTVSALPKDLPDSITIDVTNLGLNESYRVIDIETDTIKIMNNKSVPVVRVMVTRASRAAGVGVATDADADAADVAE